MARQEEQGFSGFEQPESGLCVNNCGFFGSSATLNMCSKCYHDHLMKSSQAATTSSSRTSQPAKHNGLSRPQVASAHTSHISVSMPGSVIIETKSPSVIGSQPTILATPVQPAMTTSLEPHLNLTNRCHVCKRKVGLTGFKCRCEGLFCSIHRYSDKHECTFDYKAAGREAITKACPVIKADKIERL